MYSIYFFLNAYYMKSYVGGATLIASSRLTVRDKFEPIIRMLNASSSNLSDFIYSSLKGFMLKLTISDDETLYKINNRTTSKLSIPVTEYILKIVVLSRTDRERLPPYVGVDKHHTKMTESRESFFNETKMQMSIWRNSLRGSPSPICPSVANFAIFEHEDAIRVLEFFHRKNTLSD